MVIWYFFVSYYEFFCLLLLVLGFCFILFGIAIFVSESHVLPEKRISYESGVSIISESKEPVILTFVSILLF